MNQKSTSRTPTICVPERRNLRASWHTLPASLWTSVRVIMHQEPLRSQMHKLYSIYNLLGPKVVCTAFLYRNIQENYGFVQHTLEYGGTLQSFCTRHFNIGEALRFKNFWFQDLHDLGRFHGTLIHYNFIIIKSIMQKWKIFLFSNTETEGTELQIQQLPFSVLSDHILQVTFGRGSAWHLNAC